MSEYIEREFALNVLCRENCGHNYEANKCNNCYTSNFINYLPAADVAEVKRGKWIGKQLDNFRKYEVTCSNCGWIGIENYDSYNEPSDFNYCPNCGAKMDLED